MSVVLDLFNQPHIAGDPSIYDPSEFNNFLATLRQTLEAPIPLIESSDIISFHFFRLKEKVNSGDTLSNEVTEFIKKLTKTIQGLKALITQLNKKIADTKLKVDNLKQSMAKLEEEKSKADNEINHTICVAMSMEMTLNNRDWLHSAKTNVDVLLPRMHVLLKHLSFLESLARKAGEWMLEKEKVCSVSQQ